MGGITFVMTGDFRQTLPVVPNGTRADEVHACIKSSSLWSEVSVLHLTKNMRASSDSEFSTLLLEIGNGESAEDSNGNISLSSFSHVTDTTDLITAVYNDIEIHFNSITWLRDRAILCPKNESVDNINNMVSDLIPGVARIYNSFDSVVDDEQVTQYPIEFLNSLQPTGFPPHSMSLKIGMPVMLLRNLNPPKLCNGSRLQVHAMKNNILDCVIMSGKYAGETCLIPRIPLNSTNLPFQFQRLQYPVKPCYAITINKSQGQTLSCIGVELSRFLAWPAICCTLQNNCLRKHYFTIRKLPCEKHGL